MHETATRWGLPATSLAANPRAPCVSASGSGGLASGQRLTTFLDERALLLHPRSAARGALGAEVRMNEIDLERALNDPAGLFGNPDAVVHHPALTREQKIQILNHWRLDASRLEGSEAEGMAGEDAPMLHRVHVALAALMGQQ